jgi:hypothetical protein
MSMRHPLKVKLDGQKKTDDEMIKHDDENESSQTTSARNNLNRISQIISHISRQDAKHVTDILSQQTVSVLTTASKLSSKRVH